MPPGALLLILLSAVAHATWNYQARRAGSASNDFFLRMLLLLSILAGLPALLLDVFDPVLPWQHWEWMLGSFASQAFYIAGLARAYQGLDFAFVYPVARALPVLTLGLVDAARGRMPGALEWAGMLAVAVGCLLVPCRSWREIRVARYARASMLPVLAAALGAVGYTTCDKVLVEALPEGPFPTFRYTGLYFLGGTVFLLPWALWQRRLEGQATFAGLGWRGPARGAALNLLGYWLVLWAYQLVTQVSLAFAFRQVGIVLALAYAALLLHEPLTRLRLLANGLILAGLVAVAAL